jgi:hypothetical protein
MSPGFLVVNEEDRDVVVSDVGLDRNRCAVGEDERVSADAGVERSDLGNGLDLPPCSPATEPLLPSVRHAPVPASSMAEGPLGASPAPGGQVSAMASERRLSTRTPRCPTSRPPACGTEPETADR